MSPEKIFKTSDIKLAAFLLTRNILVAIQPNPRRPQKAEFVVSTIDEVYRAIADYNSNEVVPVQTYNENLEVVKDRVMEIVRHAHGLKAGGAPIIEK